jgi:membrane-bound lytic murein transglycosylase D
MKVLFHWIPQSLVKHTFILCSLFVCTHLIAQSNNGKQDSLVDVRAGFSSLFNITATGIKDKSFQFELNKSAVGFIQSYMEKQGPELIKMKTWAKPYFSLSDEILIANGIPVALKYLSVIESHLTPNLTSSAGAVGPWQLMPDEAERLGLKMTPVDERTDFKKSTLAAATILKELYAQFGDWLLVVAAYNGGAGRVSRALKKKGTNDFWQIEYDLPLETRNHVKKFIATHYVMEGDGGWTTITASEAKDKKGITLVDNQNMVSIEVSGRFQISIIAKYLSIAVKELEQLNPKFDQTVAAGKLYSLKLPKDRLEIFEARKNEILQASLQALYFIKE